LLGSTLLTNPCNGWLEAPFTNVAEGGFCLVHHVINSLGDR